MVGGSKEDSGVGEAHKGTPQGRLAVRTSLRAPPSALDMDPGSLGWVRKNQSKTRRRQRRGGARGEGRRIMRRVKPMHGRERGQHAIYRGKRPTRVG